MSSEVRKQCLDDNTIAAFIDGQLAKKDRALVLSHLHQCRDCYQLVVDSIEVVRELENFQPMPANSSLYRRWLKSIGRIGKYRAAGIAIPVAASLMLLFQFKTESEWRSERLLAGLSPSKDTVIISSFAPEKSNETMILGFSGGKTEQQVAFMTGILVVDARLSTLLSNRNQFEVVLKKMNELVLTNKDLLTEYPELPIELNNRTSLDAVENIEEYYLKSGSSYFYKLGLFTKSALALSSNKRSDLIKRENLDALLSHAEFKDLPPGITRRLAKIGKIISDNKVEKRHEIIYKITTEIQLILS